MPTDPFGLNIKPGGLWGTTRKKRKRQLTHAQKIYCWENNSHTCHICSKRVSKFSDAEFDHIRSYKKGGATNLRNVKIVHRQCNRLKGTKSLSETKKLLGIKSKSKKKRKSRKKRSTSNPFEIKSIRVPKLKF